MMRTSPKGIKAISLREGTVLHGYKDSKGLLTVGVGHLVQPGEPYTLNGKITQAESDRLLAQDLHKAESTVNSTVKVPLTQNQFDALVSFVVNIGDGGFRKSQVLKKLNERDYDGAAKALMNWVKPPEIRGRRESEQKQFLNSTVVPTASKPDVPSVPATDKGEEPTAEQPSNDPQPEVKTTEVQQTGGATTAVETTVPAGDPPDATPTQVSTNGPMARWLLGSGLTTIGAFVWNYIQSNPSAVAVGLICATLLIAVFIFRGAITDAIRMTSASDPGKKNVS